MVNLLVLGDVPGVREPGGCLQGGCAASETSESASEVRPLMPFAGILEVLKSGGQNMDKPSRDGLIPPGVAGETDEKKVVSGGNKRKQAADDLNMTVFVLACMMPSLQLTEGLGRQVMTGQEKDSNQSQGVQGVAVVPQWVSLQSSDFEMSSVTVVRDQLVVEPAINLKGVETTDSNTWAVRPETVTAKTVRTEAVPTGTVVATDPHDSQGNVGVIKDASLDAVQTITPQGVGDRVVKVSDASSNEAFRNGHGQAAMASAHDSAEGMAQSAMAFSNSDDHREIVTEGVRVDANQGPHEPSYTLSPEQLQGGARTSGQAVEPAVELSQGAGLAARGASQWESGLSPLAHVYRGEAASVVPELPYTGNHSLDEVFRMVRERVLLEKEDGSTVMQLRLDPEELGSVRVELTWRDNTLSAEFTVDRPEVIPLLKEGFWQLEGALSERGINIDLLRAEVSGQQQHTGGREYRRDQTDDVHVRDGSPGTGNRRESEAEHRRSDATGVLNCLA